MTSTEISTGTDLDPSDGIEHRPVDLDSPDHDVEIEIASALSDLDGDGNVADAHLGGRTSCDFAEVDTQVASAAF